MTLKNPDVLSKLMKSHRVRSLGLKEESLTSIIDSYENALLETLLD